MLEILRCPNCIQRYQPGARTCTHCGFSLVNHGKTKTQTMDMIVKAVDIPKVRGISDVSSHTTLAFTAETQSVMTPIAEEIIVGRCSDSGERQPDVDLEPFAALTHGISRHHVMIRMRGSQLFIRDMASRNGTWLNDTKLQPNIEQLLCDNDELRLGNLPLKISFKQKQPVTK